MTTETPKPRNLEIVIKTARSSDEIRDLLALDEVMTGIDLEVTDLSGENAADGDEMKRLGQILVERKEISPEDLARTLQQQQPLGEMLINAELVSRDKVEAALLEQKRQKLAAEKRTHTDAVASIRVNCGKLDKLVDLVGEMVTVQDRLSQVATALRGFRKRNPQEILEKFDFFNIQEEICRLTNHLRDNALSIRMLPVEATFNRFKRLVFDLAAELGKEIELTMRGVETEIDKTVIDRLDEPLMHLIRNCADHGIESCEVRERNGKPRKGTIHLEARHVAGSVLIRIEDDGAGLNKDLIRQKGIERKLISPTATLTDKEVYSLIFLPGFSTAGCVSNVSGRGVGMDVVKKTVESLRGTLDFSSTPGKGMRFDIALPLTLAIIEGLLVTVDHQAYILPLNLIEECIELQRDKMDDLGRKNLVRVRGSLIPFLSLREAFGLRTDYPPIEQIIISEIQGQKFGFAVDRVIGEHKTVIKPLGKLFKKQSEFSGTTILGDGTVALIVDFSKLLPSASGKSGAH
jgi:two-component system chemotaxis sensor kinase CheA